MAGCRCCPGKAKIAQIPPLQPIICLVPKAQVKKPAQPTAAQPSNSADNSTDDSIKILDDDYIKKHFKLPQRSLYLDPMRRPLITFPMTQEDVRHFNLARKYKVNQQILDGYLDGGEAIMAPSVLPYEKTQTAAEKQKSKVDEQETIYILQLPDWEYHCPIHNKTVRTPRFLWHSSKKDKKEAAEGGGAKLGGGPMNKPKPWLLSRHTDFDLMSQW